MWLKVNGKYHQNPKIMGGSFTIRNDDLDGSRMLVKEQKTHRRKMVACLRIRKIPAKVTNRTFKVVDLMPFRGSLRLYDCIQSELEWDKSKEFVLDKGLSINSDCIVEERPAFGVVMNEESDSDRTD